ncbi:MAG: helix-turn-helix domain-containing protein [Candidatus Ventricola sp.]
MEISFLVIGLNMRKARKAAHLTQEQAAERIGLSTLHYGRIERGQRQVSLKQLARIGTALGTPFEALLADCVLDQENASSVLEAAADQPRGCAEYALILLDQYRDQLKAFARELQQTDARR